MIKAKNTYTIVIKYWNIICICDFEGVWLISIKVYMWKYREQKGFGTLVVYTVKYEYLGFYMP